jgi:hypothetical protein
MQLHIPFCRLGNRKCLQTLLIIWISYLCLFSSQSSYGLNNDIQQRLKGITIKADKSIAQAKRKEIITLVLRFIEDGSIYILTSKNAVQLINRIEEFCTRPLSEEIYERSIEYLNVATEWNSMHIKSIFLVPKGNEVEAVVHCLELQVDGEEVGMRKATLNLKWTKRGWRIYKQHYE